MSAGGLAVKRMAVLFTYIKGSIALYNRIGDMKAFNVVRQHFGVLRDVITANNGALVKTIGRCGDGELSRTAGRHSCRTGHARADQALQR